MAITAAQATKIDRSNRACQDASLGTAFKAAQEDIITLQNLKSGVHTVTAGEVTATKVEIDTTITLNGALVSITRSNLQLGQAKITLTGTILKIESNSSNYVLTAGDLINFIAF